MFISEQFTTQYVEYAGQNTKYTRDIIFTERFF